MDHLPVKRISDQLGDFASRLAFADIPPQTIAKAKLSILDSVGIAFAASTYDFAYAAATSLSELGNGEFPVMAMGIRLPLRDAALLDGMLVHGLDYDDTHIKGVIHPSASCFPCALLIGRKGKVGGEEFLTAYIVGVEAAARIAMAAKGKLQQAGFHPTGAVAVFACALVAGRLMNLTPRQLAMAQGITLSMAAASMEFFEEGSWTKRMHPGWAAASGITAASLAKNGFTGPQHAYEGRFGFFNNYLNRYAADLDLAGAFETLGKKWEVDELAIKPYASCHFNHSLIDAAIALVKERCINPAEIDSVKALLPAEGVKLVCEPRESKLRPQTANDAQGSLYYSIAAALVRGKFDLRDLQQAELNDPAVLALAEKVTWAVDPNSAFPNSYSGEVLVTTKRGEQFVYREKINRGAAERPLGEEEVRAKFFDNMRVATSKQHAERIAQAIAAVEQTTATELSELLRR